MGISRVSSACYRMEVEIACRFATTCRQMCADTSQATPAPFKLAMIPCSYHLCHSQCTVDTSKCLSAITWVLWGKKKNYYSDFSSRSIDTILPILQFPSLISYSTCTGRLHISHHLNNLVMCIYPEICLNLWRLLLGVEYVT